MLERIWVAGTYKWDFPVTAGFLSIAGCLAQAELSLLEVLIPSSGNRLAGEWENRTEHHGVKRDIRGVIVAAYLQQTHGHRATVLVPCCKSCAGQNVALSPALLSKWGFWCGL